MSTIFTEPPPKKGRSSTKSVITDVLTTETESKPQPLSLPSLPAASILTPTSSWGSINQSPTDDLNSHLLLKHEFAVAQAAHNGHLQRPIRDPHRQSFHEPLHIQQPAPSRPFANGEPQPYFDGRSVQQPFPPHNLEQQHLNLDRPFQQRQDSRASTSTFSSGSPRLVDLLAPGTDLNRPPDPSELRPARSPSPYLPSGLSPPLALDLIGDEDEADEEIVRSTLQDPRGFSENGSFRLPVPESPSSISSSSSEITLYTQPHLSMSSPEMLMMRFDKQTCGILSVKDGPTEKPMAYACLANGKGLARAVSRYFIHVRVSRK